jgi:hypothetical protein
MPFANSNVPNLRFPFQLTTTSKSSKIMHFLEEFPTSKHIYKTTCMQSKNISFPLKLLVCNHSKDEHLSRLERRGKRAFQDNPKKVHHLDVNNMETPSPRVKFKL